MSSENYRYYRLEGIGHLEGAEWFHADSDDEATARIRAKHPDSKCEIWKGERLVASIAPTRLQA